MLTSGSGTKSRCDVVGDHIEVEATNNARASITCTSWYAFEIVVNDL